MFERDVVIGKHEGRFYLRVVSKDAQGRRVTTFEFMPDSISAFLPDYKDGEIKKFKLIHKPGVWEVGEQNG